MVRGAIRESMQLVKEKYLFIEKYSDICYCFGCRSFSERELKLEKSKMDTI